MLFAETFGEFIMVFVTLFALYAVVRATLFLGNHLLSAEDDNSKLRDRNTHLQYINAMNVLSAYYWRRCYEHLLQQNPEYAADQEKTMEEADLMLANHLGECRADMHTDLVDMCLTKGKDKDYLMEKINKLLPND